MQAKADITVESGQYDPETLLDLAIYNLAVVTDRQPALNKASVLLAKVCAVPHGERAGRTHHSPAVRRRLVVFSGRVVIRCISEGGVTRSWRQSTYPVGIWGVA